MRRDVRYSPKSGHRPTVGADEWNSVLKLAEHLIFVAAGIRTNVNARLPLIKPVWLSCLGGNERTSFNLPAHQH
jgi:hypothetical protein